MNSDNDFIYSDMGNEDDNEGFSDSIFSDLEDMRELITITDEDGNEIELCVIDAVLHEGKNYLLCIENSEIDEDSETEAYIFKETTESEDSSGSLDTMNLSLIEDDDEFNRIIQLFQNDDYELIE